MTKLKPVTSLTLAFGLGVEQIAGHSKDHIPELGGAPEPHQVRPAVLTGVTTTTAPPDSAVNVRWVWDGTSWRVL